ncbi:LacI family DNA-binding transcriptional regulator [Planococcus sp. N028]|uniref:LacI family DNA-binding transcriptional regulator n=1 Tax=Planococcus shixiaomingii TaxID=3058393 RepID=A0ABT8MZ68_9BACL|nr:LacI family DNA-binding transcriptional regulator [Planococcus sp. N028]MDN7240936.1 LacI family DNA-binding transcriptional regulator [Planococcus sp. N028]
MKLTIKKIAEMAEVSRTTVSRVLNDSGYVSGEARDRVLAVINATGYVPSQQAKSLRTKKTKIIGVILPKLSTETSSRIVNGMNDVFQEHGYNILLTSTNLDFQKEIEYLRLLKSKQVDGIILVATNINPNLTEEILNIDLPFVAIGQEIPGVSCVTNNDYAAAKEMTELLIGKGYESIGFIGVSDSDRAVGYARKQGFLDTIEKHQLVLREEWIQSAQFDIESGYEAMRKIGGELGVSPLPRAVVCVTDRLAIGAMQYIKEKGFHIPTDISVTGMGASEISRMVLPALTTIDFENEKIGQQAAYFLLEQINSNKTEEIKWEINYRLLVRDSI